MSPITPKTPENPEDDSVWKLLEASPRRDASPVFLQNTLRRVRLEDGKKTAPWWRKFLTPRPLIGSALAACAALVILVATNQDPGPTAQQHSFAPQASLVENDELVDLQDELSDELLFTAAENPDLFSDQEVLAFLQ